MSDKLFIQFSVILGSFILILFFVGCDNSYQTNLNDKIDKLEHDIGYLEDDLNEQISELKEKIEELESDVESIKDKLNIY